MSSSTSLKILKFLNDKPPQSPVQIAKQIDVAQSNISTKLGDLKKRKLVECVNPESHKWRFYKISIQGKKVLKEMEKVQK